MSFYDDVLRELLVALGAALFLGNLLALARRRFGSEPHAPSRPRARDGERDRDLAQAPLARTLLYMALGLVVMVWGIASLAAG